MKGRSVYKREEVGKPPETAGRKAIGTKAQKSARSAWPPKLCIRTDLLCKERKKQYEDKKENYQALSCDVFSSGTVHGHVAFRFC